MTENLSKILENIIQENSCQIDNAELIELCETMPMDWVKSVYETQLECENYEACAVIHEFLKGK